MTFTEAVTYLRDAETSDDVRMIKRSKWEREVLIADYGKRTHCLVRLYDDGRRVPLVTPADVLADNWEIVSKNDFGVVAESQVSAT